MAIHMTDKPIRPAGDRPPPPPPEKPKTAEELAQEELDRQIAAQEELDRQIAAQKKAQAAADAKERAQAQRAAARYSQASADLQPQIAALKDAIQNEFKRTRKQNLRDIDLMLSQQLDILKESSALRGGVLLEGAADTNKDTGDVQERGFRNLVRERADSMTAILEQGAGETDALRAMLVNTRNWTANASEANRAYFDTMQSINQGITDLNVDTKTTLANAHMTGQGKYEEQWQAFYDRRAEAMTQLGNLYGSRIELLGQAQEASQQAADVGDGADKKPGKKVKVGGTAGARANMKKWFAAASNELGKSYVQKPLPDWIDNWEGTKLVERRQENTNLASAPIFEGVQRAQGATLRKWGA
jgi:hypothetical protein